MIKNINDDEKTVVKVYEYEEALKEIGNLPSYLIEGKPIRWIKLTSEDVGCPCGGTHVKSIKDINEMKITKISNKGKIVRISYSVC